jgi:hypothetical protein
VESCWTCQTGQDLACCARATASAAPEQKLVRGTFSWTGGTGKYAGICGDGTYVDYPGEFLPLAEGTVVSYVTFEGSYRTPTQ